MRFRVLAALIVVGCSSGPRPTSVGEGPSLEPSPPTEPSGVDGMRFVSKEGLRPELPPTAPAGLRDKVKIESIRVLANEGAVAKRVNAEQLRLFLEAAILSAHLTVGMSDKPIEVAVRFDCTPGKHTVTLESKGEPDPKLLQYLYEDLRDIPPLEVTADIAFQLAISVADPRVYDNWMDGKRYVVGRTYLPQGGPAPIDPNQKVKLQSVRLLTLEADLAKRTSAEELAAFGKAIHAHAEATVGKGGKSAELMVQVNCTTAGCTAQIATKDDPDEKLVQKMYDAVKAMPALRTTGDVAFQLHFVVVP